MFHILWGLFNEALPILVLECTCPVPEYRTCPLFGFAKPFVVTNDCKGQMNSATTLKEFALRAIYRLTFGENSTIAKSLGQNDGQLIYVRKQTQLTEFGKIILKEICLPQDLQNQVIAILII